jgi:hypothetical protein
MDIFQLWRKVTAVSGNRNGDLELWQKMEGTWPLKEKVECAAYKTKQQEIETTMLPLGKAQILWCFMFVLYKEIPYT